MGIQGLLPFLKDATQRVNVRKYSGYTVAVDTYCWIHRGAFGCALQLAKGEKTDMYVRYCLKFVNMLRAMDIKPILVFDGSHLPAKKAVEKHRHERRELYSEKGKQFLREGKVAEARDCFSKCINVTPHMALAVIKAARSLDVDCIVAPYEADAQLAYLATCGIAQAVITEDSDLLAFGCPRVIFKLDLNGNGMEIEAARLNQAVKLGQNFSADKFRHMCIASGCDYLASLPGIGLGKARKLFQSTSNPDLTHVLKRIPIILKMKLTVPSDYITGFQQANNTFLYQLAFDPIKRKLVPLRPYADDVDRQSLSYAGSYHQWDLALQHALGNVDPNTRKVICDFKPPDSKCHEKSMPRHMLSIWHKDYRVGPDYTEEDKGTTLQGHTTKWKEVMVNAPKLEGQRRKRCRSDKDDNNEDTLSNDDLTSIYCSPHSKRHSADDTLSIPETPDAKDKKTLAASSQSRNPFSKESQQSPKCGFGAGERVVRTLSKRNIFAKGWSDASCQPDRLKGSTVITSRFFPSRPDPKLKVTDEGIGNGLENNSLSKHQSLRDDEMSASVLKTVDKYTESATTEADVEQQQGSSCVSILKTLQCFQRTTSVSAMHPLSQNKLCSFPPTESTSGSDMEAQVELNTKSEHKSSERLPSDSVISGGGVFKWSERSTKNSTSNFRWLNDFQNCKVKARLVRRNNCRGGRLSGNEDSCQGVAEENMLSSQLQHSQLCSTDANPSRSSKRSGHFSADYDSEESESTSVCMNNSSKDQSKCSSLNLAPASDKQEQDQGEGIIAHEQRNEHILKTSVQYGGMCDDDIMLVDKVASTRDDVHVQCGRTDKDKATNVQIQGEEFVDKKTLNDGNTTDCNTRMGLMTRIKSVKEIDTKPTFIPKQGSSKPSQCRASGLSRCKKKKKTSNKDENKDTGTSQQTLFAFMKKNHERKGAMVPLSPCKENIIQVS